VEAESERRASVKRFAEYGAARDETLRRTDTASAPWTVVNSNVKRRARLEAIRHVLDKLPYPSKDESAVYAPDPRVVQPAASCGPLRLNGYLDWRASSPTARAA
jgi:hypothetical protein